MVRKTIQKSYFRISSACPISSQRMSDMGITPKV